ncbi:glycosyltransferase family 2 protein [Halovenus sp. HT40]|uniref:glycosyltransferase family 2 protein n=1 Tax=Halovenus sp. HT40 TaxID=3126691 RepID=UPI00300E74F5
MEVSVVVCTHASERFPDLVEAVESLQAQRYDQVETVVISDGNDDLAERIEQQFGGDPDVQVHCNETNRGVSYSRTKGAKRAAGDIVAFIDDDAVARPDWIENLVAVYEETDALAVGGRMAGQWLGGDPWYLPEEFYWLVGVTHRGFAEAGEEVRNTYESNISFRRDVFLDLGGFDTSFGPTATTYSHSEGAEIGTRLKRAYDRGVVYEPDAVVEHKVFDYRLSLRWLVEKSLQQGESKYRLGQQTTADIGSEAGFLRELLLDHVPRRLAALVRTPSKAKIAQFVMLFVLTGLVGVGYLRAALTQ